MKSDASDQTRSKFTQIYRYLQAFNELRNPTTRQVSDQLWTLWFHDLPGYPTIQKGDLREVATESEEFLADDKPTSSFILKVARPEYPNVPKPPQKLLAWLQPGWQEADQSVWTKDILRKRNALGEIQEIRFEDDPELKNILLKWMAERNSWVAKMKVTKKAMQIFEDLFALHSRMEKEAEQIELVLGDGMLFWQREEGLNNVYHPILLQRLRLLFDPSVPEFTLVETEQSPELYTSLFRAMTDVKPNAIARSIQELDEKGYHPLGGIQTSEFLNRLVTQLSSQGQFIEHQSRPNKVGIPFISRDPVIFLRKRTLGYSIALEKILDDLSHREQLPSAVANITGVFFDQGTEKIPPETTSSIVDVNGEDEQVLLSKEANAEQLQIAQRLERNNAVLVQGPPGTGKTHSIANLLGHLLSQGKTVLVTSHTTKALSVLREKVVEPLQPLCVSLLNDGPEGRQQLEKAIDTITDRLSMSDLRTLESQAKELETSRTRFLKQLRELRTQLKKARQDEYRPIVVAGEEYDPSKAAQLVDSNKQTDSWIPSPVALGAPLPLSVEEIKELYLSNTQVTTEDENEFLYHLPRPEELVEPRIFVDLIKENKKLHQEDLVYKESYWKHEGTQTPSSLQDLLDQLLQSVELLKDETEWRMVAVSSGRQGESHSQLWYELLDEVQAVYDKGLENQSMFMKWGPDLKGYEDSLETAEKILADMLSRLHRGKKIGILQLFFKKSWKQLLEKASVNGKSPKLIVHFEALAQYVKLQIARKQLLNRWERQVTALEGPSPNELGQEPEKLASRFGESILQCLQWHNEQWLPVEKKMIDTGLDWNRLLEGHPAKLVTHGQVHQVRDLVLQEIPKVINAQIFRLRKAKNEEQFRDLLQILESLATEEEEGHSVVVNQLKTAVQKQDPELYQSSYKRLVELHERYQILKKRRELLDKLEKSASSWAFEIRHRQGLQGGNKIPGNPKSAWLWRQLHDELEKRAQTSMEELQKKIILTQDHLREVTAQLVETKAWAQQVRNTTRSQQQALQEWKALIRKVGKGKGTRAPRLLAEARKLMPVCQSSVPVWIMPLSRVVENFDPARNSFDVVIIDEASQSDVMALTALYLGKQVVVVGDDEQVSPDAVGTRNEEVQQLIDTYLKGIPSAQQYDGVSSIYDLAKTSFPLVSLKEHFRCVTPIIQFSNSLSYDGAIKPLRDASGVLTKPYTVSYQVDGEMSKDVNEAEAATIAALLMACTEQPEYAGKTFGVISLKGEKQAARIESILRHRLSVTEYHDRKIRCGNPAQFQGDERHVMFLSMVYSPAENGGPLRLQGNPNNRDKKRLNVAASRAQDQMWVIHSVSPEIDLKPEDMRRKLIQHAKDPYALSTLKDNMAKRAESEFEKRVIAHLVDKGYKVTPQWEVGAYRIDIVVEGNGKRLAVECDGDRFHPPEKWEEDMARQAILERLGWRFVRIRGSQFFRDPHFAMHSVYERLQEMGIEPSGIDSSVNSISGDSDDLKSRVVRRAEELRADWVRELQMEEEGTKTLI